jgi:DNA-binding transcriptional MerR regulator
VYRIGVVARFAQVSVRTLRHYDELGLLVPAQIDDATGYRWYGPEEIAHLHRILVLRDLGVSLNEIRILLDEEHVTSDELRGILFLRRAEARERIDDEQRRLARVEARIRLLEGDSMVDHDVTLKQLDATAVIATSEQCSTVEEVTAALGRMYPRLHHALVTRGLSAGPFAFALYDDLDEDWKHERVTAALAVDDSVVVDDDDIDTTILPAVRAATTIVRGAPDDVYYRGFQALHDWLEATGPHAVAQLREVYIDCDGPRDSWVTELQAVIADRVT